MAGEVGALGADVADEGAQPAVGRIRVQPGVPEQGDPDPGQGEGQGPHNQIAQQGGAVVLRHRGHQVAAAHQRQRGGKAGTRVATVRVNPSLVSASSTGLWGWRRRDTST